jgi:hypothetical protein
LYSAVSFGVGTAAPIVPTLELCRLQLTAAISRFRVGEYQPKIPLR